MGKLNLLKDNGYLAKLPCAKCDKETDHEFLLGWSHDDRRYASIHRCIICGEKKQTEISYERFRELQDAMASPMVPKN